MSILSLFKRSKEDLSLDNGDLIAEARNWYSDRYATALVQRNILLVLLALALVAIFIGVFMVGQVTLSKSIEPFVIEVEHETGLTNIVNPARSTELMSDEAVKKYFIVQYIRAREGYDVMDYEYNYSTTVRLLSTSKIYREFKSFTNNDPLSPVKKYGSLAKAKVRIRSIQFFEDGMKAQVRFTLIEDGKFASVERERIATMFIAFEKMEMTAEERYVNPLGFQVIGYRVDDEAI